MHAVACVKDGDRGRTLRWSCALWRALVEFYGEGKGGSNPEGEVVEDVVRGPTVWSVSDLSATRTQGREVTVSLPICACLCCFPEATFSSLLSFHNPAARQHTILRGRKATSGRTPWSLVGGAHAVACRGETDLSPH